MVTLTTTSVAVHKILLGSHQRSISDPYIWVAYLLLSWGYRATVETDPVTEQGDKRNLTNTVRDRPASVLPLSPTLLGP